MATAYANVVKTSKDHNLDLRKAAFVLAITRALEIILGRGIFP
jgi:glutamate dehydrogenase/leucine dehydrogenase